MKIQAAVAWEAGATLSIEEFDLDDPRDDEILVRVEAVGVCHTDDNARLGRLPVVFPIILGHEGAGTVERSGGTSPRSGRATGCCSPRTTAASASSACSARPRTATRWCRSPSSAPGRTGRRAPIRTAGRSAPRSSASPRFATHSLVTERNIIPVAPRRPAALPGRVHLRGADRRGRDPERHAGAQRRQGRGLGDRRGRPGRRDGREGVGRGRDRRHRPGGATASPLPPNWAPPRTIDTTGQELADVAAAIVEATGRGADVALDTTGNPAVILGRGPVARHPRHRLGHHQQRRAGHPAAWRPAAQGPPAARHHGRPHQPDRLHPEAARAARPGPVPGRPAREGTTRSPS